MRACVCCVFVCEHVCVTRVMNSMHESRYNYDASATINNNNTLFQHRKIRDGYVHNRPTLGFCSYLHNVPENKVLVETKMTTVI